MIETYSNCSNRNCHSLRKVGMDARSARDRKSTRLNSSHRCISYAVFCLKKKMKSIERELLTLPDSTIVYSGHGPETTVGRERRANPFLTGDHRLGNAPASLTQPRRHTDT